MFLVLGRFGEGWVDGEGGIVYNRFVSIEFCFSCGETCAER